MRKFSKILSYIETKLSPPSFNIIKTLWINFRTLPFSQALKLPIHLYGKWNLRALRGHIVIDSTTVSFGMIKMGLNLTGYITAPTATITLMENSTLSLSEKVRISQGVSLCLYKNAELNLGYNSHLGDNVKVVCAKKITIGRNSEITWECQILDHGSHFIVDKKTCKTKRIIKPVNIEDYCWIGNRTTIMPGTCLPKHTIVASNSIINKDYVSVGLNEYCLIGGQPAKLIKGNVMRVYNRSNENFFNDFFNASCENECVVLDEIFVKEAALRRVN